MKLNPETFTSFISKETFLKDALNFRYDKGQTYDISYPEFINYFKTIPSISKHHLIIGINFTYGWMPTIFNFKTNRFEESVEILNKVKNGNIPSISELKILKGLFNDSIVGTSKLLHFIAPDKFAIWDSRVYRYLTEQEPYESRIGNCDTYLKYLDFCNYLTSLKEFENIHKMVSNEIGYPMTKLRTVELIMYQTEKNKKINAVKTSI
jgi:hypothetical protein